MATYQYTAVKMSDKSRVRGTIKAETERQARELLRQQELYPTNLQVLESSGTKGFKDRKAKSPVEEWFQEKFSSVGLNQKITFTQNLGIMVKAGIPITEALLYMESYIDDNPRFKQLVQTIRADIMAGMGLSKSLGRHPKIFNDTYTSIIQAGEASGELESVLERLAGLLIAQGNLQKKVISAMVYPAAVIAIVCIVLTLMFVLVIPTFTNMYNQMGIKLPLITQIMVWISDFMRNFWYICILMIIGGGYGFSRFAASEVGKEMIDKTLLKIPVVTPLVLAVSSSHFISTLQVSFAAGLPITDCIFMACNTVQNVILRRMFDDVNIKIQAGQRLAASMADTGIFPGAVNIMLSTGEESGTLDSMLVHCLEYLEEEVNQRVEVLMSLMEPVLLVVLGGVVGAMALAVYLPLFGMYESMGK